MKKEEFENQGYKINVATSDGLIIIDEKHPSPMEKTIRSMIDTKEKAIKEALMGLGWTPPREDRNKDFHTWWHNEGSGITLREDEDIEEFVKRVCEIAWGNGAYKREEEIDEALKKDIEKLQEDVEHWKLNFNKRVEADRGEIE